MSFEGYKWLVANSISGKDFLMKVFKSRFGDEVDYNWFVDPKFSLADPFLLKDMDRAVGRIIKALENDENICIYGDYDTDGVTSTALLWGLFNFLGKNTEVYIPKRQTEGYGLNKNSLKKLKDDGIDLIITVDCGIRSVKEIEFIKNEGLDIVVTDHHKPGRKLPDCEAVLDPHREGCNYPEKNLAGVGVVYTLCRAILQKYDIDQKKADWWLKWNLDLVAIGTIGDLVDIKGENRILVKYGLKTLQLSRKNGLRKLVQLAGRNPAELTSRDVGFIISPRLNAAGRLGDAMNAFNLLTEKDELELDIWVNNLHNQNQTRQKLTDQIVAEAEKRIDREDENMVIMLSDENWLSGVVGLVCSKLTEKYNKVSFIGEIKGEKIKGSVRSIEGIDVVRVLDEVSDLMDKYGGHEMAGGFLMPAKNWQKLKKRVREIVNSQAKDMVLEKKLYIDALFQHDVIAEDIFNQIRLFEPFGMGNEEFVLSMSDVEIASLKKVGKNQSHIKLIFKTDNGNYIEGMWWKKVPEYFENLNMNGKYNVVFRFEENIYNGNRKIFMNIIDMAYSLK